MSERPTRPNEMLISLHVSFAPGILDRAQQLIDVGRKTDDKALSSAIFACGSVMVAAALEEALEGCLARALKESGAGLRDDEQALQDALLKSTRWKLINAPTLLSMGAVETSAKSQHLAVLHRLISLRNALMHTRDLGEVLGVPETLEVQEREAVDAASPEMSPKPAGETSAKQSLAPGEMRAQRSPDGQILVEVGTAKSSWDEIALEDAERFLRSARAYIEELLLAEGEELGRPREVICMVGASPGGGESKTAT